MKSDNIGYHFSGAQDHPNSPTVFFPHMEVAETAIAQAVVTALSGASHAESHKQCEAACEGKMTCSRGGTLQIQGASTGFHHRIWPTLPSMERDTKTQDPLDGWSSSHHLPVWSRVICQTPAAVSLSSWAHTCYCVTACLKNVGCCRRENDCSRVCANNLRTSACESLYHARYVHKTIASVRRGKRGAGKKGEGEGEEEAIKSRLAMLGKCFCDHTVRFKTVWKWSPHSVAPSSRLLCP